MIGSHGWRASRNFAGGDPGAALAWRMTQAEAEQVRVTAMSPLVAVRDAQDVDGMGKCLDVTTNQPCEFRVVCMRAAIRLEPMPCRVRVAEVERQVERQVVRQDQQVAMNDMAERLLACMIAQARPLTFAEILEALAVPRTGDLTLYNAYRGAWHHLLCEKPPRISAVGKLIRADHKTRVKVWVVAEQAQEVGKR
jgi:hypothetical protein